MERDFKLGPSLVGAPAARGHVPDPWRVRLLRDYLDGSARSMVALTSKSALRLLLQEWAQATLTVPVRGSQAESADVLRRRLQSSRHMLAQRGAQGTTLALKQHGRISQGDAWWTHTLSALGPGEPAHVLPHTLSHAGFS